MAIHKRILDCFAALAMTIGLFLGGPAYAQTFPELTGRIVDQANLLDPAQEADLTSKLAALETQTGRQFVVATVNSLEGRTIEDYGYRFGRHWGIGQEQTDDGVILLVAPNEKKVRVETGYGARVFLTDVVSGRIIRNAILPRFRDGDFAGGIAAGADQIIQMMQLPAAEAQRRAQEIAAEESARAADRGGSGGALLPMLFVMIIFFVMLRSVARRTGGRRYRRRRGGGISPWVVLWGLDALGHASRGRGGWGGGGGFGGFGGGGGGFGGFSGGGGSFGGGGASGGW